MALTPAIFFDKGGEGAVAPPNETNEEDDGEENEQEGTEQRVVEGT